MNLFLLIVITILAFLAVALNIFHFYTKMKKSDKKTIKIQIFLMIFHVFFIISIIYYLYSGIKNQIYLNIEYITAITMSCALLSSTFAFQINWDQHLKFATINLILGIFIGILLLVLNLLTDIKYLDGVIIGFTIGYSFLSILGTLYFLIKYPISPIFGYLIAQITLSIIHIIGGLNAIIQIGAVLIVNIVMYLGYKGKYNFIQKTNNR